MVGIPLPQTALRGRFFRSGDATSRRGGSGVDVGHPVWETGIGALVAARWGILSGGQVEKGLRERISLRHGGQPQGPPHRSTPPLPLRDILRYCKNLPV